jgi:EAL domain-containing protein (putative c-di-GMP-specific phosphodiesterase class I)
MYQAKTHGKDRLELFTVTMREQAQTRLALENDLHYALERQEFELLYQPILSLASDQITGFEALLRWHHPQRGLISPSEFILIAEETGLILPIGQWVLLAACRQLYEWQTKFPRTPTLTMNVNISGRQFAAAGFLEQVEAVLQEVAIDPHTLRLEITEGVWLNSSERAIALFKALHDKGVQFHIDDFGTGYSSLAYLQNFPIQTIKIDHTFVSRMGDGRDNIEIVGTIIAMAHDLGMDAVAEGIETAEQLDKLKRLGCNYGQGYLLSRPGSQAETEKLLLATSPHADRLLPAVLLAA